jgi:hypothetical protein
MLAIGNALASKTTKESSQLVRMKGRTIKTRCQTYKFFRLNDSDHSQPYQAYNLIGLEEGNIREC